MNLELNQVVSLFARLDPGLTKDFLLSSTIPIVICSSGLIRTLNAFEYGSTFPRCFLPIFNTVSIWRRGGTLSPSILLYNGVISLHGIVLASFVWRRNRDNRFFETVHKHVVEKSEALTHPRDSPFYVKLADSLFMSGMMSLWNTIPYLYTLRADGLAPSSIIGLSLISVGAVLQAIADYQKKKQKDEKGALSFCTDGVYSLCRHPNYLGEVLFHLGVLVSGYSLFPSIPRWLLVGVIPLINIISMCIVTSDKASKQAMKYSSDVKYVAYQGRVKKLIPFVW